MTADELRAATNAERCTWRITTEGRKVASCGTDINRLTDGQYIAAIVCGGCGKQIAVGRLRLEPEAQL